MPAVTPIVVEQTVNASVPRVWRALTDLGELRRWYFPVDIFEPVPGCEFNFHAGPPGHLYHHQCVIIDVVPNARLSHTWRYPELYPECNTLVSWRLLSAGENETRVRLTHAGVDFPKTDPSFAHSNFIAGWTEILGKSLKPWVENCPR